MPPQVGRMPGHQSNPSNPYAHLNPTHNMLPQYQQHLQNVPGSGSQHGFGSVTSFNAGISPFAPSVGGMGGLQGGYGSEGGLGGGSGLGSEAAYRGFARGAALQAQQAQNAEAGSMGMRSGMAGRIREVWASNLEQEMVILRQLIIKYPFVSMDAEFPGIVVRPMGDFSTKASYHYQTLRVNVDLLKPIQIGITLWTPEGELPPSQPDPNVIQKMPYGNNLMLCPCTWSFNFKFDANGDMGAEASIELLKGAGLDFDKHKELGIDHNAFGATFTDSGMAYMDEVNWLSFHSGYDFGYLVKLLWNRPLPQEEAEFNKLVGKFFPKLWDIKYLLRHAQRTLMAQNRLSPTAQNILGSLGQKSGLNDLAAELGCQRVGNAHTGGSDSWLTGQVFWAMRQKIFDGHISEDLADQIYGLHGVGPPASASARDDFLQGHQTPSSNGAVGFHTGHTPSTHQGPSTPTSGHAGVAAGTPGPGHYAHQNNLSAHGGFGNFSMGPR